MIVAEQFHGHADEIIALKLIETEGRGAQGDETVI
jgi:hypothetical protein